MPITVNKFGRNPDVDIGSLPADIFPGVRWFAPTVARIHNIISTEAADNSAGLGARTVRVTGLLDWVGAEFSEDITLNGLTDVPTVNSYVIIYRMECLTFGGTGFNIGDITATAQGDLTETAKITALDGQTLMAVFGFSSSYTLEIFEWYVGMNRMGAAPVSVDAQLCVNLRPDQADGGFVVKHHLSLASSGNSHVFHTFDPPFVIPGPAIVKVQTPFVSHEDTDVSAGFDGRLI